MTMMTALLLAAQIGLAPEQSIPWSNDEPAHAQFSAPVLASDGNGFLAAWRDVFETKIHLRHFDAEGRPGQQTTIDRASYGEPRLVAVDAGYLVVAQLEHDNGPSVFRFDTTGKPVGRPSATLYANGGHWSALAWNGTRALVATSTGSAWLAASNGAVIAPEVRFVDPIRHVVVEAASAGSDFLLLHDGPNDTGVYSRLITQHGAMPRPSLLLDAEATRPRMAVASMGDAYVLLWSSNGVLRAQRTDVEGRPLGAVKELGRFESMSDIAAMWTGSEVAVIVTASTDVVSLRLSADLTLLARSVLASQPDGAQREVVLAASRRAELAMWRTHGACIFQSKVTAKRVDDPAAAELLMTPGAPRQTQPAVSFAAGVTATAYLELRENARVRMAFLPSGKQFAMPARGTQSAPSIATNGSAFLVSWSESSRPDCTFSMFAAAVSLDGRLLAPPVRLGSAEHEENPAAIVWTGGEFAVFWESRDPVRVVGARVRADGTLIDAEPVPIGPVEQDIFNNKPSAFVINATWTGSETFVVWSPTHSDATHAQRVTRELTPIGELLKIAPIFTGVFAWNGDVGIVVYGFFDSVVYANTVSRDGKLGREKWLALDRAGHWSTVRDRVLWDGNHFIVARGPEVLIVNEILDVVGRQRVGRHDREGMGIALAPSGLVAAYETTDGIKVRPGSIGPRLRGIR